MNRLTPHQIKDYNLKRQQLDANRNINLISPCVAPYNNMYFTTEGQVAPCWLLVGYIDQWSSKKSLNDIWNGEKFKSYRENLKDGVFNEACKVCKEKIESDTWPLAIAYDEFSVKDYPTLLELELSNQCNLECIMCEGRLSSGIRKNRDKLPPLPMIYDDSFIEQLKEFIPHLEELRFNGGEPFAQKIVYDICMLASKIKPSLKINIATNGTVYNKQVKEILDKCNIHLNISIDSLEKENYESIRINGNFDSLMNNFKIFNQYCKENNRVLSVMINPMRNNWWEMPNFVKFAKENLVHIWFNTIHHPEHLGIWNLPVHELVDISNTLKESVNDLKPETDDQFMLFGNWEKFDHFVNKQIKSWIDKQLLREQRNNKRIIEIKPV